MTVVVSADEADRLGIAGTYPCEWIALGVTSDLAAVGFLADVTARLAAAGISANVVSACHHDHLFVPVGRVGEPWRCSGSSRAGATTTDGDVPPGVRSTSAWRPPETTPDSLGTLARFFATLHRR